MYPLTMTASWRRSRLAETYARIALTEPVLNAVRERLQLDATIEEMEARVRTELPLEETVLTVIAQVGRSRRSGGHRKCGGWGRAAQARTS